MSLHIGILGHGSLEDRTAPQQIVLGERKYVVMYAPPGAAMAGGYADDLYRVLEESQKVRNNLEGWTALLREKSELRFRTSKGASDQLHNNLFMKSDHPKIFKPGEACYNYTVTGDRGLHFSGVYRIAADGRISYSLLRDGETLTLAQIIASYGHDKSVYFHWLCCASDHTRQKFQATSLWEDMKIDFNMSEILRS